MTNTATKPPKAPLRTTFSRKQWPTNPETTDRVTVACTGTVVLPHGYTLTLTTPPHPGIPTDDPTKADEVYRAQRRRVAESLEALTSRAPRGAREH